MSNKPNCWGFRINWKDAEIRKFLVSEIHDGRLRQGWGWLEEQALPNTTDRGARANLSIYNKVRKGDYLLIPHCPLYPLVTIVRAAQNFSTGYRFQISEKGDYGHIFPIEKGFHVEFTRSCKAIEAADLRTSLRTPMRFWNMSGHIKTIDNIIHTDKSVLLEPSHNEQRAIELLNEAMEFACGKNTLEQKLDDLFETSFQSSEWEFALRKALELVLPNCIVKRVGGKNEAKHGCDLAVYLPSIENQRKYVIGIQIKDHCGSEGAGVIDQIRKSEYWEEDGECKLVDKFIILIDATRAENGHLEKQIMEKDNSIRVLYKNDVLDILSRAAKIQMAKNLTTIEV